MGLFGGKEAVRDDELLAKIEMLETRIKALEHAPVQREPRMGVVKNPNAKCFSSNWDDYWFDVPVTHVVLSILAHLKLDLAYKAGTTETITLVKKGK